jgi:hypothetical protein
MRTDDLIKAISADAGTIEPPIEWTVAVAVAIGTFLSSACFLWFLGPRPDFSQVIAGSVRFVLKFVVTLSLGVPAFFILRGLSRPDFIVGRRLWLLGFAPAILFVGSLFEMSSLPPNEWHSRMIGHNSSLCMTMIPLLSLAPFTAVFYALKAGAPANPTAAGAVGGLLSAAIAATLYATRCTDDSPLFVALWYPFGIVLMTLLGALFGRWLLRW